MDETPYETILHIPLFVGLDQQGTYFTVPFEMPDNTESLTLSYHYQRHIESQAQVQNGVFIARKEANIIDLGLIAPDGTQVGASGADKLEVVISETYATPGYTPCYLTPGQWQIIVGVYKVADEGVDVTYELTFAGKYRRLYKGDLHVHTLGSDGVLDLEEITRHSRLNGLDYLAITDHNQMVSAQTLREYISDKAVHFTLIPGIEWTHYQGHATFLGLDQPYDEPFMTNSFGEVNARFSSARSRGALICISHPCDPVCPFLFDMNSLPFDCLEVWNGPMRGSNLQAIGLWQSLLISGKKVPICGGSDYHRDSLLLFPGGPATCVYAMSPGPSDILLALKQGHAYITYSASGPTLEMTAGEAILGDSVAFSQIRQVEFSAGRLLAGDVVQVVTGQGSTSLVKAESDGEMRGVYTMPSPGFARIEVLRSFLPGLPLLPALISNPIYFDG